MEYIPVHIKQSQTWAQSYLLQNKLGTSEHWLCLYQIEHKVPLDISGKKWTQSEMN